MSPEDDDLIPVLDDEPDASTPVALGRWRLLIVDDDPEVHLATDYALQGFQFLGRGLETLHAYSAQDARSLLDVDADFAVILLDVVMETEDAGLQMISHIRDTLNLTEVRIILRTGQPGQAPELSIFNNYDINDYRTKSELTRTRLITAVMAALRSYHQIQTIAQNRRGLEMIVHASSDLMESRAIGSFAQGVLTQLSALLHVPVDGIVCVQRGAAAGLAEQDVFYVVGAAGRLARHILRPLGEIDDPQIVSAINTCVRQGQHQFGPGWTVVHFSGEHQEGAVYVETGQALADTDRQLLEVFATNISSCYGNIRLVEQLHHVAYHDPLTGLSNRTRFIRDLDEQAGKGQSAVVALIDLRHFADLNDGLGHDMGNALLVAVAQRLRAALGRVCRLARVGADVFGVIGDEAQVNPARLTDVFALPLEVEGHQIPVAQTLGLCRLLGHETSGLLLLKHANIALNRAKRSLSAHYEYFVPEMEDAPRWRLEIIHRLRQDFQLGRLQVWYQPKIDLKTGQPVGVEALLRWPAQGGGGFVQGPDVFIPLAEYSGLISELGNWVLTQACAAWRPINQGRSRPLAMAVNVSMPQFRDPVFAQRVAQVMQAHEMAPGCLELEITESVAMDEPKVVVGCLAALRAEGVRVAIDDFGTGYSSLAHLRQLPIDALKIDKAFVQEIHSGQGGAFAETMVALGKKLGVQVVAEGVETGEQAGFLRGLACDVAQGYLYAPPMPLADLVIWLQARP